jgi:hypothetical protein
MKRKVTELATPVKMTVKCFLPATVDVMVTHDGDGMGSILSVEEARFENWSDPEALTRQLASLELLEDLDVEVTD